MVDDKPILDQAHEVQNLVPKITAKGISIDETLQVPVTHG